jgi:hypothetical protein
MPIGRKGRKYKSIKPERFSGGICTFGKGFNEKSLILKAKRDI